MICIKIDDRDQVLHQWDTGQRLVLRGVPGGAKVDFYHEGEEPLGRESYEEDGAVYADIPDVLLQAESKLYACVRVQDETVGETVYKWFAIVHPRPKPSDYIYTEEEKKTWEELQAQIDELKENGAGNSTLVQSVNGIAPDENGNVEIDFDDPVETDPTVFDWAKRELFNKADLPTSIQSFVTVDGIEYYRYHAGATYGFTWYNPSPLPGAVTITARGVAQYGGTNGTRLKTIYSDGTYGPDLYIVASGESRTVTVTTDTSKTLAKITGNYDMENWVLLDMSVMSIQADDGYVPSIPGYVRTVNGVSPDENGNVGIVVSGGNVDYVGVEPAEDDIPCVYLYTGGAGMPFTKDEGERQVRMVYESRTKNEEYYLTAKVQGSSSASNPGYKKRNWTFKFYTDNTYEKKLKLRFKGWPEMNKFVLKAGWVIPGHLRNVGAAKIWGQIMRNRSDYDTLPEELRNSANQGATDGFHVRVFIDGQYWGIYDWIVAKDQLFGQDNDNPQHSILNSELNNQPTCAFATTSPTINGNWSEELLDSMTADTKTSMENWIKFVAGSTDEEFVANAERYFDVQSVIDAICFDRIIMTVDNMCRNQIVFKYDTKWYMGKWDLDAILGLPPVAGQPWYSYDTPYQEGYVAHKDYGIINMLYKRTEELFSERFKTRYWELRKGPLSENNLARTFGQLSDRLRYIEGLLAEENASTTGNGQFTGMPNVGKDTIQQIREFVVKRCGYMDGIITNMVPAVPATGITLSVSALTFDSTDTQTLIATVEPSNSTDFVVWTSSDPGIATVENGVVTPVANGNATITATAGSMSAECVVTVAFPELSCTSITLSASTLTLDNGNPQTLTATVTPDGCTDPVTWETSDASVATVANGVVSPIGIGDAVITAHCGECSATCNVSVTDITINILSGEEFSHGSVHGVDGSIITGTTDCITGYVDVSAYQNQQIFIDVVGLIMHQAQKIVFFDKDKNFLSSHFSTSAIAGGTVPENAVYARFGMLSKATAINVYIGNMHTENIFSADGAANGMYYESMDGTLKEYSSYSCKKFAVENGVGYRMLGIISGAFFDDNGNYVEAVKHNTAPFDTPRFVTVPDAVEVGLNWATTSTNTVEINLFQLGQLIGTLDNNLL